MLLTNKQRAENDVVLRRPTKEIDTTHVHAIMMTTVCFTLLSFMHFFTNAQADTHSRGYGYSPPRRGHPPPYPSSRRAPPDPHTFDYPASLKQYADWFRYYFPQQAMDEDNADKAAEQEAGDGSKPRNGIKSKWEKYKKDFAAAQVSNSLHSHFSLYTIFGFQLSNYGIAEHCWYCSCKRCLIITGNHPGLRKNMILRQNFRSCARE